MACLLLATGRRHGMAEANSLRQHLVDELRDLLDAEQQLTRALPQFARAAATPALKSAFEHHLSETKRHLDRLNQALRTLGETTTAKRCPGMRGIISEGNAMVSDTPRGPLRDAMMISGAQKAEHYEMASYGTARTYAEVLGRSDVARLLSDTLREEKAADTKLTEIAEGIVNAKAAEEWYSRDTGVLDQSAEWVGQTVGMAARGVMRAANAVGITRDNATEVAKSVRQAGEATAETVSDAAETAMTQAQRLTKRAVKSARAVAADAMPGASRPRGRATNQRTGRKRQKKGKKR
jgi:ferritin-like metal-binding protein YciE